MLDGLRGEDSLTELCRREGISQGIYYKWSKDFMEAGKRRLAGDTARAANTDEVKELRREARDLKEVVAEQTLELRLLKKKHVRRWGRPRMRYPASEKLEIIRLVEESHLSARRTLAKLGIPAPHSIAGMTGIYSVVRLDCRINLPSQSMSGTAFLTKCGARSSSWR